MIESALKVALCDIKDITELLIVLLGCFQNQSFNPVLSWFLLRNGGKVSELLVPARHCAESFVVVLSGKVNVPILPMEELRCKRVKELIQVYDLLAETKLKP